MSFDEAKKAAATRLERFKEIHEEVRRYVIEGLSLIRLQTASRDISDAVLHQQIQKREVLPTAIQVDFKNELDVLLSEIVRRLG